MRTADRNMIRWHRVPIPNGRRASARPPTTLRAPVVFCDDLLQHLLFQAQVRDQLFPPLPRYFAEERSYTRAVKESSILALR